MHHETPIEKCKFSLEIKGKKGGFVKRFPFETKFCTCMQCFFNIKRRVRKSFRIPLKRHFYAVLDYDYCSPLCSLPTNMNT